ncbi:hypothetical protein [Brucella anthropi]|uniref:Uncharacterized protein n=1 Tax=Brucella anthropi TaxID=529 RepID=A0A6L3YZX8_BRUAN|nr:hypothetical protein [Brucella anthropi]KAB2763052.1 hypothetical protein F9L04_21685 [Brucella anthropi]UVV67044.1 hypothetical protein NW321_11280 [Brucella anthropi]
MNRRFFLKLLPVASAAVALPAVAVAADKATQPKTTEALPEKWQGDGYYEVLDRGKLQIQSVVRFSAFDDENDGRCFRCSPAIPSGRGDIVYRYEASLDAALVRKVDEKFWRVPV